MYVCIYIYIYMHVCVYIYIYTYYTYTYIHIHTCNVASCRLISYRIIHRMRHSNNLSLSLSSWRLLLDTTTITHTKNNNINTNNHNDNDNDHDHNTSSNNTSGRLLLEILKRNGHGAEHLRELRSSLCLKGKRGGVLSIEILLARIARQTS